MQGFPFDSQLTFDSDNLPVYDRAVSSQPLRKLIRDLFTTGVMPNPSTNLQVSAGTDGMTVQVQAGFAVVDGGLCQETETRTLEVTAADTTYDRIDTVVVRWNENVDVRRADLYVVAGTPSATPVRPTLQRDNSFYEIGLADIFITKRVATITDDKITDTRYESERCGIVSSVSEWDTTTIYQQIQAELAGFKANEEANFETWFDYMKDQLSEDAAGHLQQEIDELQPVRKRTITNLIDPSKYIITTSITQNGITITNNGDGTFTVNGTTDNNVGADGKIAVNLFSWGSNVVIADGVAQVRLCGAPSNMTNKALIQLADVNDTTVWLADKGSGTTIDTKDNKLTVYAFRFEFYPDVTFDKVVFKPMITTDIYASYDDYVQYSGDGKINENVAKHEKDIAQLNNDLTITHRTVNLTDLHSLVNSVLVTETSSGNVHELKFDISISNALASNTTLFKLVNADLPFKYTKIGTIDVLGLKDINIFMNETGEIKLANTTTTPTRLIGSVTYID